MNPRETGFFRVVPNSIFSMWAIALLAFAGTALYCDTTLAQEAAPHRKMKEGRQKIESALARLEREHRNGVLPLRPLGSVAKRPAHAGVEP